MSEIQKVMDKLQEVSKQNDARFLEIAELKKENELYCDCIGDIQKLQQGLDGYELAIEKRIGVLYDLLKDS